MKKYKIILFTICIALIYSCKENYTPKPHGYLRLNIPKEHSFKNTPENLPFALQYSTYAQIETLQASTKHRQHNKWYNITYPKYNAKIHLSYIPINDNLDSLLEESHKFVFEHTIKADAIDETPFQNIERDVHGLLYNLKGNSASNMEFWATDSSSHFLRGALYFSTTPNIDSLSPIIDYIKDDIVHLISTIEWNNSNTIDINAIN